MQFAKKFNLILKPDVLLLIVSQASQYLASFVIIKLLASSLSTSDFGLYNLVITAAFVISMFPFTAFDQILNREISFNLESVNISNFLPGYGFFLIFVHVLLVLTVPVLPERVSHIIFTIVLYSVTSIVKTTLLGTLNFTGDRVSFSSLKLVDNLLRLSLVFYIVKLENGTNLFLFLSLQNLFMVVIWVLFFNDYLGPVNFSTAKGSLLFLFTSSMPLLIWAPFEMLQNNLYIYFLEYNSLLREVGLFSFYNSMSLVIPAASAGFLNAVALPSLYQRTRGSRFHDLQRYLLKFVLAYIFMVLVGYTILKLNLSPILTFISKPEYLNSSFLFDPLFWGNFLFNGSLIMTNVFFAYNRQRYLIPVKTIPGCLAMFLLLLLVPAFGLESTAWVFLSVSVSQIVVLLFVYIKLKKEVS